MSNTEALRAAAQAVIDRWDSPQWEWNKHGPTADLMHALRAALAQQPAASGEPVAWVRVIDEALACSHLDVADQADDYATAKRKLNNLLAHEQSIGAYFAAPPPAPALVPLTEAQREVLMFLWGAGPLDGLWWGDAPAGKRRPFWWRAPLATAFPELAAAPGAPDAREGEP